MPEIDTDTFQVIALALSGLALVVSLLVLSAVTKLRKDMERPASSAAPSAGMASEARTEAAAPAATDSEYPATTAATRTAATEEAASSVRADTADAPLTTSAAPVATASSVPEATEELPVEQPFERDGRWWYKRGDELLVYDEGSGQWEPAPAGSLTSGGAATTVAASAPVAETAYTSVSEAAPAGGQTASDQSGGWKCPSCGAVNGATSASCRMCFTAKP